MILITWDQIWDLIEELFGPLNVEHILLLKLTSTSSLISDFLMVDGSKVMGMAFRLPMDLSFVAGGSTFIAGGSARGSTLLI